MPPTCIASEDDDDALGSSSMTSTSGMANQGEVMCALTLECPRPFCGYQPSTVVAIQFPLRASQEAYMHCCTKGLSGSRGARDVVERENEYNRNPSNNYPSQLEMMVSRIVIANIPPLIQ